jgi:threonine/homoserine/homoserine lactone efflux protein
METPDAKTRYERNSVREDWSGWVLLAGLLLETVIYLVFSKGKSGLEKALEVLANVMVFGGVFCEIYFASKAKSADAELKRESGKQVAESNR